MSPNSLRIVCPRIVHLNLYAYVGNNPVSIGDATGHSPGIFNPLNYTLLMAGEVENWQQQLQNDMQDSNASAAASPQQTMDKVAIAAEKAAIVPTRASVANHDPHEYGGLILQRDKDGKISATRPIPGQERQVDVDSIKVPRGYSVVGEYHTHPHATAIEGQGPSPTDIYRLRTPELAGRTAYVVDSYSGAVYRYNQSAPVRGPFDTAVYGTKIATIP